MSSPNVICAQCGEQNVRGTFRCAKCGQVIGAPRATKVDHGQDAAPVIGGMKIDAPMVRDLQGGRLTKKTAYLAVLAVVVVLIAFLQFAPTTKNVPSPVLDLRVDQVTGYSMRVTWSTPKSTGDGIDYFKLTAVQIDHPNLGLNTNFTSTNSTTLIELPGLTKFKITVVAYAHNGKVSAPAVVYATTKVKPPPPGPITGLRVVDTTPGTVRISWIKPTSGSTTLRYFVVVTKPTNQQLVDQFEVPAKDLHVNTQGVASYNVGNLLPHRAYLIEVYAQGLTLQQSVAMTISATTK